MKRLVFDCETDGLLETLTKLHSLVLRNLDTDEVISCADQPGFVPIKKGLSLLREADRIYGHNAIRFDIPAIQKVYPRWTFRPEAVMDTLVVARMRWGDIKDSDFKLMRKGRLPGKLIGSHSLKAWGLRMGVLKGDFGEDTDWQEWSPQMQKYCERDTLVTKELILRIRRASVSTDSVETEHALAWYLAQQERNGFPFDVRKATELQGLLSEKREAVADALRKEFGTWIAEGSEFIPKRDNKKMGYYEGATCTKLRYMEFNPASRDHISNRLIELYGWKPTEFTEGNKPTVDEGTLKGLNYPVVEKLIEYLLLDKRLGQLVEGKQAWLRLMRDDGPQGGKLTRLVHVHGAVNQNGAVTHRATHSHPNMTQVPKVTSSYGPECRGLFYVPPGWKLMGADASGLELRCLAHYMAKYDDGAYGRIILEGDIHAANRAALGEMVPQDQKGRDTTKTFIYAYLYGAGDEKLGSIIKPGASPERQKRIGAKARKLFEGNTPALKYLQEAVRRQTKNLGYLTILDGRRTPVRSEHSALNTLLQTAGALVCKRWIVEYNRRMVAKHGQQGWLGKWAALLWAHDEIQNGVREEIADDACKIAVASIEHMTEHFQFRCPLTGEAKLGPHWAATH